MDKIDALVVALAEKLKKEQIMLATAESCTGGWIAQAMTALAGSSDWFERGFVTYSNLAKTEMLGVPAEMIVQCGAVSEEIANAMAEGALAHSSAHVAVATTGIAGPTGGTSDKPVGTVWFGVAKTRQPCVTVKHVFSGDRHAIRQQAVIFALQMLIAHAT